MSSILFGKTDSYLNVGTDLEWRRVLRHHTTSLWVKTSSQARSCLVSLQNDGFEVFGIDMNVCSNPIAAASTVLNTRPSQSAADSPVSALVPPALDPTNHGAQPHTRAHRTLSNLPSARSVGSATTGSGRSDETCLSSDDSGEDDPDVLYDAFAPASVYFPIAGKQVQAAISDGEDGGSGDSDDDGGLASPTASRGHGSSLSARAGSMSFRRHSPTTTLTTVASVVDALTNRKDRYVNQMLAKARAISLKAHHKAGVSSSRRPDDTMVSSVGGPDSPDRRPNTRDRDGPTLPCHMDTERRHPAGGIRVRLQDCKGNILVAVSEIPVLADDKWHRIDVTIVPKGLQVPELLEGEGNGLRLGGEWCLVDADGDVDPLGSLMAMVDPTQDPLVVLDAREKRMPAQYMAKAPTVRYSNTMVKLCVDGQEVNMRHYTRRHDHAEAGWRRRRCKQMWRAEMAALEADMARVEDHVQEVRSSVQVPLSPPNPNSLTPAPMYIPSLDTANGSAPLASSDTNPLGDGGIDSPRMEPSMTASEREEVSSRRFREREDTIGKLKKQYELQRHLSKVFLLSSDFSSVGIVQRNLYPAPDLIGARNRQAQPNFIAHQRLGRDEGDGVGSDAAETASNKLIHYFCGRLADVAVVDNSIGADLDQLCKRGQYASSQQAGKVRTAASTSDRVSMFALPMTADTVRKSIVNGLGTYHKLNQGSFIGSLMRRSDITVTDKSGAPHSTGLVERLRWWATDSADGLTVWDRGISGTEFDGEIFARVLGGRDQSRQSSVVSSKPDTTAAAGDKGGGSGGLHNGTRIQPLHLHMCNCQWDASDSPQSAMFLDSSLGFTARIPALSRRVLATLLGVPMRMDVRLAVGHSEGNSLVPPALQVGSPSGVPAASYETIVFEPVAPRDVALAETLGGGGSIKNGCEVAAADNGSTVIKSTAVLGSPSVFIDPLTGINNDTQTWSPLKRKGTNAPGMMLKSPTRSPQRDLLRGGGGGGADDSPIPQLTLAQVLPDGAATNGAGGVKPLSALLVDKGFSFSIWLRTECTQPCLVVSFPFGRDMQHGPSHGNGDDTAPKHKLWALTDLQDAHLLLNCERYPSITLLIGNWAYISHVNVCTNTWSQIEWSLDHARSLSLRINNELSTYEAVDLSASCAAVRRHLRVIDRRRSEGPDGGLGMSSKRSSLGADGTFVPERIGRRSIQLRVDNLGGPRSRSSPFGGGGAVTWAHSDTLSSKGGSSKGSPSITATDRPAEVGAVGTPTKEGSKADAEEEEEEEEHEVAAAELPDKGTIALLKRAVGSYIHREGEDVVAIEDATLDLHADEVDSSDTSEVDFSPSEMHLKRPAKDDGGDANANSGAAPNINVSACSEEASSAPAGGAANYTFPVEEAEDGDCNGDAVPASQLLSDDTDDQTTSASPLSPNGHLRSASGAGESSTVGDDARQPADGGANGRHETLPTKPTPMPRLQSLLNSNRRTKYELAEKDRRYERHLKRDHNIDATDRHRLARTALVEAGRRDKRSASAPQPKQRALSTVSEDSVVGADGLTDMPEAKTRADRILRVLMGVIGEVREAAHARSIIAAVDANNTRLATRHKEASAESSPSTPKVGAVSSAPLTFSRREEGKLLSAIAAGLQRYCHLLTTSPPSNPAHVPPADRLTSANTLLSNAHALFGTSFRSGSNGFLSSGDIIVPPTAMALQGGAPTMWRNSRPSLTSGGDDTLFPFRFGSMSRSSISLNGRSPTRALPPNRVSIGSAADRQTPATAWGAADVILPPQLVERARGSEEPSRSPKVPALAPSAIDTTADIPKAHTYEVTAWVPTAALLEGDASDDEEGVATTHPVSASPSVPSLMKAPDTAMPSPSSQGRLVAVDGVATGPAMLTSHTFRFDDDGTSAAEGVGLDGNFISPLVSSRGLPTPTAGNGGHIPSPQLESIGSSSASRAGIRSADTVGISGPPLRITASAGGGFGATSGLGFSGNGGLHLMSSARKTQIVHASHALQVCTEAMTHAPSAGMSEAERVTENGSAVNYHMSDADVVMLGARYCGGLRDLTITFGDAVEFYFPLSEGRGRDITSRPPNRHKPRQAHFDGLVHHKGLAMSTEGTSVLKGFAAPYPLVPAASTCLTEYTNAVAGSPSMAAEAVNGSALVDALQAPMPHGCIASSTLVTYPRRGGMGGLDGWQPAVLSPTASDDAVAKGSASSQPFMVSPSASSVGSFNSAPALGANAVAEHHRSIVQVNITEDSFLASLLMMLRLKVETTGRTSLWEKAHMPSSYCVVSPAIALRLGTVVVPSRNVHLNVVGFTVDPDEDDEGDEDAANAQQVVPVVEESDDDGDQTDELSHSQSVNSNTMGMLSTASASHAAGSVATGQTDEHREDDMRGAVDDGGNAAGEEAAEEEEDNAAAPSALTAYMRKKQEKADRERRKEERAAERSRLAAKEAAAAANGRSGRLHAVHTHVQGADIAKGLRRVTKSAFYDGTVVFKGFVRLTPDGEQNFYGHVATLNGVFVLEVDREAVRVTVRDTVANVAGAGIIGSDGEGSMYVGSHTIVRSSALMSVGSMSGNAAPTTKGAAASPKGANAASFTSSVADAQVIANPLPTEHQAPIPGLSNAPYALIPREQALVIYSCSTLAFEDNRWHFIELTIKPSVPLEDSRALPITLVERMNAVTLTIDQVAVPLTPVAVDYKGARSIIKRQANAARVGADANHGSGSPAEVELGRRGRRRPTRVGFSAASVLSSGDETHDANSNPTPRSTLAGSGTFGSHITPRSVGTFTTDSGHHDASTRSRIPLYAGPNSSHTTVRATAIRCKHLDIKWRELVEYVPPMTGDTILFSSMYAHQVYIGGCGWHGGVRDIELSLDGVRKSWPLDDGSGSKFTQFPLAYDPTLAEHVKALPKPLRKPEEAALVVAVPCGTGGQGLGAESPSSPTLPPQMSASPLSTMLAAKKQREAVGPTTVRHTDPLTLMSQSAPVNADTVSGGYTAAASHWQASFLPMQALSFDGRHSVASAVNFGQVFHPGDFRKFSVSFWVKQGAAGGRAANPYAKKGPSRGAAGWRPGDPSDVRRGCLLSVHDIIYPSLEASLGIYAHTTLDMFSSPKKRESAPYTTLFVLIDSSERALVLETHVDIYDGSWHKVEWRVNDATENDTVVLINNRPAAVTVVGAEGPRDFQGQVPCLTVGARNDGDGGIREHFKGEIKNLAVHVGSERRKGNANVARRSIASDGRRHSTAFTDPNASMTPVLEWPMGEGRGGLLYDTLKNVVGVVLRPMWGVTSFPPQVPRLSSDSTLRFASISDLSRAFFKRGVRIDITLKTGHTGIGSVYAIQSPSRRIVGGLVLNTNGGTSGTLLTPAEQAMNFKVAKDGVYPPQRYGSVHSVRSVLSDGRLRSPRHHADDGSRHRNAELLGGDDDAHGGIGLLDPESPDRRLSAVGANGLGGDGRMELHEPGTHTLIVQHVTKRFVHRPDEQAYMPRSQRSLHPHTWVGGDDSVHSFSADSQPMPLSNGSGSRDTSTRSQGGSDRDNNKGVSPRGGRKRMVLARGNSRLHNFAGPQLVTTDQVSDSDSDASLNKSSKAPSPHTISIPIPLTTVASDSFNVLEQTANESSAADLKRGSLGDTAAAMAWHLAAATASGGLPPQRIPIDQPSRVEEMLADAAEGHPDDSDHYGGRLYRSARDLRNLPRSALLGTVETVIEEIQFQFHCDELSDENWHQVQVVLPSNPYAAEVFIDEIRMPLLVVTAKVVAIVPDEVEEALKGARRSIVEPPSPAEHQFAWESLVVGRTARARAFVGDIKNISVASFDDSSFLYVPLANNVSFSTTMPREVATSNIDWELTVSPPSCLSFADQEYVELPPIKTFRYHCFQVDALLSAVNTDARSCFLEYGACDSGLVAIHFNEDIHGNHAPFHVHVVVMDRMGRELSADFRSGPPILAADPSGRGAGARPAPYLFDSKWHRLRIVVNTTHDNNVFAYLNGVPVDVRYGNCGSPSEFAYADEGGTIGAQVIDLKPLLPFCGKLQHFSVSDPRTDEVHASYEMDAGYGSVLQDGSGKRHHAVIHNVQWKTKMAPEKSTLLAASGHTDALIDGEVTILTPQQLNARRKKRTSRIHQVSQGLPTFELKSSPVLIPNAEAARRASIAMAEVMDLRIPPEAKDLLAVAHKGRQGDRTASVVAGTLAHHLAQRQAEASGGNKVILTSSRWCNSTLSTHHRSVVTGDTIMPYWPADEGGWESGALGPQWITIDLGRACTVFAVTFELPRSFSTSYQLYFSRINLNESYSANRPAMEEQKAVPTMSLVQEFHFTASTSRSATTSFPLPYFNVRWIRLRCSAPQLPPVTNVVETAAAIKLRQRQLRQLYVTLRSLTIMGLPSAYVAPKRETVVTVMQRQSIQMAGRDGSIAAHHRGSAVSALRAMASRSGSLPFELLGRQQQGLSALKAELAEAEAQQEAAEEAALDAAEMRDNELALLQASVSDDEGASPLQRSRDVPNLESIEFPSTDAAGSIGNTSALKVSMGAFTAGADSESSPLSSPMASSRRPMSQMSLRPTGEREGLSSSHQLARNTALDAQDHHSAYTPLLLQLRQPHLAWRKAGPSGAKTPNTATPAMGSAPRRKTINEAPMYVTELGGAYTPMRGRLPTLPPLTSTPPAVPTTRSLYAARRSNTPQPIVLRLGELPPCRLRKAPEPTPDLVPHPSQIPYPRSTLGVVPQPLPPLGTADDGVITTDGALVSGPAFERYVQVTNEAERKAVATQRALRKGLISPRTAASGKALLSVGSAMDLSLTTKGALDDPVEKERAARERELQLLYYRYDVSRAGAIPLEVFWDLYEAAGGGVSLGGDGDGDDELLAQLEDADVADVMPSPATMDFFRRRSLGPQGSASSTNTSIDPVVARLMTRERERRMSSSGSPTPSNGKRPISAPKRSAEDRERDHILRALAEVGVHIPYNMLHGRSVGDNDEQARRAYLFDMRRGQSPASPALAASGLLLQEDPSEAKVMITFEQFSRVIGKLQRD